LLNFRVFTIDDVCRQRDTLNDRLPIAPKSGTRPVSE
jgi:hypothetical protein